MLAERDQVPTATKAAELLRTALELEEDVGLVEGLLGQAERGRGG